MFHTPKLTALICTVAILAIAAQTVAQTVSSGSSVNEGLTLTAGKYDKYKKKGGPKATPKAPKAGPKAGKINIPIAKVRVDCPSRAEWRTIQNIGLAQAPGNPATSISSAYTPGNPHGKCTVTYQCAGTPCPDATETFGGYRVHIQFECSTSDTKEFSADSPEKCDERLKTEKNEWGLGTTRSSVPSNAQSQFDPMVDLLSPSTPGDFDGIQ